MLSRRLTMLVGVVLVAVAAVWLLRLAGGAARENDREARASLDTGGTNDGAGLDVFDTSAGASRGDGSLPTAPYSSTLPGAMTTDSLNAVPPEKAPPVDPGSSNDTAESPVLERPVVDSSFVEVERRLESRRLAIPVKGVRRDQLVDTYTATRSEGRTHNAIDIVAAAGTPVIAAATGTVVKLFNSERGGVTLYQLDPDGRTVYYYAHLAGYAAGISEGNVVRQGEIIGYVGDTGNAGPGNAHLHFEITIVESPDRFWTGTPVNPYPLLRGG